MTAKAPVSPREMLAHLSKKATRECDKKTGLVKLHAGVAAQQAKVAAEKIRLEAHLTTKEKKVVAYLNENPFGCSNSEVVKLMELLFGKSLPVCVFDDDDDADDESGPQIRDRDVPRLAMLVPLKNPNSHNYEIGKPALVTDEDDEDPLDGLLKVNGHCGNAITDYKATVRLATDEEIDAFFAKVPTAVLREQLKTTVEIVETTLGKELTGGSKRPKKKAIKKKAAKKKAIKKKAAKKKSPKR